MNGMRRWPFSIVMAGARWGLPSRLTPGEACRENCRRDGQALHRLARRFDTHRVCGEIRGD